ncbi:MAG: signal recognition particle-docking protein FtsY [Thermoplasmatota archaeon]
MFKSLKEKLAGVSQQLEDELEKQLEAELEAELAASLEEDLAPTPEPEPVPEPEPEPVAEPEPAPSPEPEPRPEPEATPEPSPAPSAPVTQVPPPTPAPAPTPPATPTPTPAAPAAPKVEPPQPKPQPKPAAPAKPAQPSGRKELTAEEIEARLARELEEAVEIQKEVEEVVTTSTKKATKFTINEDVLEDILWELEVGLLESDVALPVIEAIKENVKEQLLSLSVSGNDAHAIVEKVLRTAVRRVLNVNPMDFDAFVKGRIESGQSPTVVMFVGVNGTGKTTSIARMAYRLQQQGISCVMAAGDTFRAGAIAQLSQHGDKLGIKVVKHGDGADPAAVAYDAIEHAKARNKQVVLLDTAGRMQTNRNLMDEMDKIRRVATPHLTVFVGDSLAGNDAVEQARQFDKVVDIDGAILTKTDVDAKGGAALSVAYTINKPLLFVGVGQGYGDLMPFDPQWMVDRLFGDEGDE